ncbi:hypothetical protein JD276_11440 [Leucobacter sp. CSA1]|uniref:Solute-binding protein family 3/N-terminal domain-containing protein n=1 Tax=Leucobacter chromiisoli TaxID=2796471 RepID=A0A934UVM9_9MICO|nr:hypothetical protein [Leucobacter chromiisoli]MBK0419646.1 hypothetical protein [Leucobacter chromiisoli]
MALAAALAGCGLSIPADPDRSLEHARGDELRVGIAVEPRLSTAEDPPRGPLPDLARGFAEELHARVVWEMGSEESLVRMLEEDEIDLALGDFSPETPWSDRSAVSRPFAAEGVDAELVALLPAGENALLSEFEGYIDATRRAV